MKRIICGLFAVIGLLCVIFPQQITAVLPYVLGISMAGADILYCLPHFHSREARVEQSSELASGCVLLVAGIVCMVHGAEFIEPYGDRLGYHRHPKSCKTLVPCHPGIRVEYDVCGLADRVRRADGTLCPAAPVSN